ncbi:MAG: hypothetical protein JSU68_00425 [Phycisphaerales bacterium]|nr:MAG: hypothetical protein JSU68_00425 [Phycisphaerales bacterium]
MAEFIALSDIAFAHEQSKSGRSIIATMVYTRAVVEPIGQAVSADFARGSLGTVSQTDRVHRAKPTGEQDS